MYYKIEPAVVGSGFNVFQYDPQKGKYWKQFVHQCETREEAEQFIQDRIETAETLEKELAEKDKANKAKFTEALKRSPWVFANSHVFHQPDERYER